MRKCVRCGNEYGPDDDLSTGAKKDPDWDYNLGRCYGCDLDFCYELYGGLMEPAFHVNGLIDGEPMEWYKRAQ